MRFSDFSYTDAAAAFIATSEVRETSPEIMQAIVSFARNEAEAIEIWEEGEGAAATLRDVWERVTGNGLREAADYCWGASGTKWWSQAQISA